MGAKIGVFGPVPGPPKNPPFLGTSMGNTKFRNPEKTGKKCTFFWVFNNSPIRDKCFGRGFSHFSQVTRERHRTCPGDSGSYHWGVGGLGGVFTPAGGDHRSRVRRTPLSRESTHPTGAATLSRAVRAARKARTTKLSEQAPSSEVSVSRESRKTGRFTTSSEERQARVSER